MRPSQFCVVLFSCLLLTACGPSEPTTDEEQAESSAADTEVVSHEYVGTGTCKQCHETQYQLWSGSHHELAMQVADERTILGDFNDASFEHFDTPSTFFRRDEDFFVNTLGPDGEPADYQIAYTFGAEPLQQYLIRFPGGALQALGIAWDTRPEDQGGQRWFHLYPDQAVRPGDALHWAGPNQNWNYQCADCHSTNLDKRFHLATKTYDTTWSEITVGCEACHGPGSQHLELMRAGDHSVPSGGFRVSLDSAAQEIETCAPCHSRRGAIAGVEADGEGFLNRYLPSLLDESLYHADGQILEEVYVYGSFLQSKMQQRGVRCSDCHDPHGAQVRTSGNDLCTRCHQERTPAEFVTLQAKAYDSPEHHFHESGSPGARCVNCHMPSKLYMVVDERRDHSFRIPRPDLSVALGTPNACNACHDNRSAQWAADEIASRFGEDRPEHFAEAFTGGRARRLAAEEPLSAIATNPEHPGIVRATSLSLLGNYRRALSADAIAKGIRDEDPLVRVGALRGSEGMNLEMRWQLANPLLADPVRAVRLEAVRTLAEAGRAPLSEDQRARFDAVLSEFLASQTLNDDRPEAHMNRGVIFGSSGDAESAEAAYRAALDLDADFVPGMINLADLYRGTNRDGDGGALLQRAVATEPENASAHHALGLWLVRQDNRDEAIASFERAHDLDPASIEIAYVYGVALHSAGRSTEGLEIIEDAHELHPDDTNLLYALATISHDAGEPAAALRYAEELLAMWPYERSYQQLVKELREDSP